MPNYAIIRVEKHTSLGTIAGIGHHLDRTRETPNADPNRSRHNRTWNRGRWVSWEAEPPEAGNHLKAFQERLKDFQARGGKVQKNAVLAIEVLLSASPEAFLETSFQFEEWLIAQERYQINKFGRDNIISLVLHLDEETPHVHAVVIPEIERVERRGRKSADPMKPSKQKPALAASQWIGSRQLLVDLQTDYAAAMSQFGLVRGKERSGAKHVPPSLYYAQGEALVSEVRRLRSEVEQLRTDNARLAQAEQTLSEAQTRIDQLQADRSELRDRIRRLRDERRSDAEDLGVIRTIKETLPGVYEQVIELANQQLAIRAKEEIARMTKAGQAPDSAPPAL